MIERACGNGSPAELLPRALVGFGWRRGLRGRSWLEGQRRVESRQRRAQRIQAWGAGKVRIPRQSGQGFRFDVGHRSDLIPATIPK
jgi:hypothetical protein